MRVVPNMGLHEGIDAVRALVPRWRFAPANSSHTANEQAVRLLVNASVKAVVKARAGGTARGHTGQDGDGLQIP